MAWARCTTHGPIQDAREVKDGFGNTVALWCRCGLKCAEYHPEGFRAPEDLEGVQVGDNLNEAPQVALAHGLEPVEIDALLEEHATEKGWYDFNGVKRRGRAAALRYVMGTEEDDA